MISKINLIQNVGKFYNCVGRDDSLRWSRNTFILAPNASGKSTLVAILRSLAGANPDLVIGRKTLNATNEPRVVLRADSTNVVFENQTWNSQFSNLHFFDVPYIQENILSYAIDHNHKKNIHKIVIGAEGARLANQFAEAKAQEKLQTREKTRLESVFSSADFQHHTLDEFLAISGDRKNEVSQSIETLRRDLQLKESEQVVRGLGLPVALSNVAYDLVPLKDLGTKTLASQHEAAERRVLAHIDKNSNKQGQALRFLQEGTEQIKEDCPFCGQDLGPATELITAYREYFDTELRGFFGDIAIEAENLRGWNYENAMTGLLATHNSNIAAVANWQPYIGAQVLPDLEEQVAKAKPIFAAALDGLLAALEIKRADPSNVLEAGPIEALESAIADFNAFLAQYNASVTEIAALANQHIEELPASEIETIRESLSRELEVEARFQEKWTTWVQSISANRIEVEELARLKTEKETELDAYSRTIFVEYQDRLNQLLERLGTDFRIVGLTGRTDDRSRESYSDFGFMILEQQVPISARAENTPSLKNTLSEGDKSTLAFAFFIASMERHPDLNQQVVILDDPLSSLDETRREATSTILRDLAPYLAQICVLTHKKDFLYMLCDEFSDFGTLFIRSDATNGSRLERFDVSADRRSELQVLMDKLERYTIEDFGPTPELIQGDIRKVFEIVLKNKYLRRLAAVIGGGGGLGTILGTLDESGLLNPVAKRRLYRVCGLTNAPHHGGLVIDPARRLSRAELIPLITEAFGLIEVV